MNELPDCLCLKVFQWLELKDLMRCCYVSKEWKRVVYDSSLWREVDLRPFRWTLDECSTLRLIHSQFKPCLQSLNISGFHFSPKICYELETHCPKLRQLILESVTFVGFDDCMLTNKFPSTLELLDLRYSTGDNAAFALISENVSNLKCLGVTNALLEHVNTVEMFGHMTQATTLDFSYCSNFYDATLILVGTFCQKLQSLALSHCNNFNGASLYVLIKNCKNLKALFFSGTSLTDENLSQCDWEEIKLQELDVSWCRNITEAGLISLLPRLKCLIYLRLCSCGFGHAITDKVLHLLITYEYTELEILDISYSREITNNGVATLVRLLPSLKQLRVSCCRKLTSDLIKMHSTNVLFLASFNEHQSKSFNSQSIGGRFVVMADHERVTYRNVRRYSFERQLLRY